MNLQQQYDETIKENYNLKNEVKNLHEMIVLNAIKLEKFERMKCENCNLNADCSNTLTYISGYTDDSFHDESILIDFCSLFEEEVK